MKVTPELRKMAREMDPMLRDCGFKVGKFHEVGKVKKKKPFDPIKSQDREGLALLLSQIHLTGLEVLAVVRRYYDWRAITVANRENYRAMINDAGIDKDKEWK